MYIHIYISIRFFFCLSNIRTIQILTVGSNFKDCDVNVWNVNNLKNKC